MKDQYENTWKIYLLHIYTINPENNFTAKFLFEVIHSKAYNTYFVISGKGMC